MLDFRWTELLGNGTFNHTLGGCNEFNANACECTGYDPGGLSCNLRDKCVNFDDPIDCSGAAPLGRCVWSQGSCMSNTCAFPQVSWFDTTRSELQLESPKLPVPDQLLTEAMETALQSGKDSLNEGLKQNALCLPPEIAKYLVPPPTVHMFKQHTVEHPDHGFLELVSSCGSGADKACLAHRTHPASGRGGTDCLPPQDVSGVSAVVSRGCVDRLSELTAQGCSPSSSAQECKPLVEEVSMQCSSPDQEEELVLPQIVNAMAPDATSLSSRAYSGSFASSPSQASVSYVRNGVEYSVGVYAAVVGKSCVASCAGLQRCSKTPDTLCCLDEQRFQNDRCSGFSVKTCVGDMYMENTFANFNCTGELMSNKSIAAGVCTTTVLPLMSDHSVSMQVTCPHVINRTTDKPAGRALIWVLSALAVVALCAGVVTLYNIHTFRAAFAGRFRGVVDLVGALYDQAVEYWQPVRAASSRYLEAAGEACSVVSAQAATCCTLGQTHVASRAGRWYANAVRACTALRGLSYNPRKNLGIHDWIHVVLMLLAAFGYAAHLLLWYIDDPFAAFDRNVIGEVGLDDKWIDAVPVQNHFAEWSEWGQRCQAWACMVIVIATAIGLIDQVSPKLRSTIWMATLAAVMIGQVSVMLVPSFLFSFNLELYYNANHSFTSDPKTKSEADGALSLAFGGVALTFVSNLFVFMLHGLAPGVFLGSCVFCSHLSSLQRYQQNPTRVQPVALSQRGSGLTQPLHDSGVAMGSVNRQSFSSFTASTDTAFGSRRFTFALGSTRVTNSWLTPRRATLHISDRVLSQQQPRVRILNWLSTLGAPCGGCLPVIIVYQSLGADVWWALMWPLCWVAPAVLMFPLSRALESRGRYDRAGAMTNVAMAILYIVTYGSITAAILVGLVAKAKAGGFKEFTVTYPASTFISTTLGTMAMTLSYLESSILADATKEHIGEHFGSVVIGSRSRASSLDEADTGNAEDSSAEWSANTVTARVGACVRPMLRFLLEYDEQMDPHRYGRRLPSRRLSLMVGLGLCSWVLTETYHESGGFEDQYVLKNVKELLVSLDTGLQWPEGNATVLDEAFDVYGDCCKAEFMLQCCAVLLLMCACWCDICVRDYHGLQASRVFGFVGLAVMFCSSLVYVRKQSPPPLDY